MNVSTNESILKHFYLLQIQYLEDWAPRISQNRNESTSWEFEQTLQTLLALSQWNTHSASFWFHCSCQKPSQQNSLVFNLQESCKSCPKKLKCETLITQIFWNTIDWWQPISIGVEQYVSNNHGHFCLSLRTLWHNLFRNKLTKDRQLLLLCDFIAFWLPTSRKWLPFKGVPIMHPSLLSYPWSWELERRERNTDGWNLQETGLEKGRVWQRYSDKH